MSFPQSRDVGIFCGVHDTSVTASGIRAPRDQGTTEFELKPCTQISVVSDQLLLSVEAEHFSFMLLILGQWGLNLKHSTVVANREGIPASQFG